MSARAETPLAAADLDRLLLDLVGDFGGTDFGRACLNALADRAGPRRRWSDLAAASPHDLATLRQTIKAMKAADLAVGDIVVVDGWVLARTEAEILALATLLDAEVMA